MNAIDLANQIKKKQSFLCIGLDSEMEKLPKSCKNSQYPQFEFNKQIIDATAPYTIAIKPNIAFYEAEGRKGWESLALTAEYCKKNYPDIFLIADAKRGDIGNTSKMYAKTFLSDMPFDAITLSPYMGSDSIKPFMEYPDKWVILLALTSNTGAMDFQFIESSGRPLYMNVIETSKQWGNENNTMYVVGATKTQYLEQIRCSIPNHFLLVPGVGAQGGSLEEVYRYGKNKNCGLIVNASRSILFANSSENFAEAALQQTIALQKEMEVLLNS
ncbi:MAG: orotidine-5'-phosphate decarboxylase [Bacteroidales bacterium]